MSQRQTSSVHWGDVSHMSQRQALRPMLTEPPLLDVWMAVLQVLALSLCLPGRCCLHLTGRGKLGLRPHTSLSQGHTGNKWLRGDADLGVIPPQSRLLPLPGGLSSPLHGIHLVEHGCPVELVLLPLFPFSLLNPHSGNGVPGKVSYAFLHNALRDHAVVTAAGERRILSPGGRCRGVVLQAGLTTAPALLSPCESEPELMA